MSEDAPGPYYFARGLRVPNFDVYTSSESAEYRKYGRSLDWYMKDSDFLIRQLGWAVDDLADLVEWLRSEKLYAQSDRVRTIAGRLARAMPANNTHVPENGTRHKARGWE